MFFTFQTQMKYDPCQLDRTISNIKYWLGKYYIRMGLTPLPKVRVCRDFSNRSAPRDAYVINE